MRKVLLFTNSNYVRKVDKIVGIYHHAQPAGWQTLCVAPETPPAQIRRTLGAFRPDGLIFEGDEIVRLLPTIRRLPAPAVFLDTSVNYATARHTVESDARAIAELGFGELSAGPSETLLFVTSQPAQRWSQARQHAFEVLCRQHGRRAVSLACAGDNPLATVRQLAESLRRLTPPLAIFAVNDVTAELVYTAAQEAGLTIPTQLRLVSVDNNPLICENQRPPLTSIEQNMFEAGLRAAAMLEALMAKPRQRPQHVAVPPRLIARRLSSVATTNYPVPVHKALLYLHAHALEPMTISDVVCDCGRSRKSLETLFRSTTGKTLGETLMAIRFAKVEELLTNPHQHIEPIAQLCGWKSATTLMRSFRARYGMTMSAWRRQHAPE